MKLLLDTHVLLWAASASRRLPDDARTLIEDPENELVFSAASLWEVAIKNSLGREEFSVDPRLLRRGLLENGYVELPVTDAHTPWPWICFHRSTRIRSTASWSHRPRSKGSRFCRRTRSSCVTQDRSGRFDRLRQATNPPFSRVVCYSAALGRPSSRLASCQDHAPRIP